MANLYLIRGIPGSGKTTFGNSSQFHGAVHFEADQYFVSNGSYFYYPRGVKEAHGWCQKMTKCAMSGNVDVVVSNTFVHLWELEPYIKMAKQFGYTVKVYRMTGSYGSIHNVPENIMDKMKNEFEDYRNEVIVK